MINKLIIDDSIIFELIGIQWQRPIIFSILFSFFYHLLVYHMPGTDISVKLLVFWLFYCFKGVEWTSTSKQGFVTISSLSFFSVGLMMMSGVAYFVRDWRILHLVFSTPLILLLLAGYWSVNPSILQCNPEPLTSYYLHYHSRICYQVFLISHFHLT